MKADLFIPCFIDQLYPQTAFSVMKLLKRAGVEVHYNPEQTCCGQPAFNSGYWKEARSLAVKFMQDFADATVVVTPSASCAGYIRNYYGRLFDENPELLSRFEQLKPQVYELSDFLVNFLNITDFGTRFPHRITYHDGCSALREYGIKAETRTLLMNVKGLELVEMKETDTCCGFGGTFSVKFRHISTALTQLKVEHAMETGAEYIVSSEASCLMNLEGYIRKMKLPVRTIHLADILAHGMD